MSKKKHGKSGGGGGAVQLTAKGRAVQSTATLPSSGANKAVPLGTHPNHNKSKSTISCSGKTVGGDTNEDESHDAVETTPLIPYHWASLVTCLSSSPLYWACGLGILACLVRLSMWFSLLASPLIALPQEMALGQRIHHYMAGELYIDQQPPLGGMIYAGVAKALAYDGKYDFTALPIPSSVPWSGLRLFSSLLGALLVPLTFLILKALGMSHVAAIAASCLVLFDGAFTVQSQYLLVDPILLVFMASAVLFWATFTFTLGGEFFSWKGSVCLLLSGVFLGLTASTHWSGIFTLSILFISSIIEVWDKVGDRKRSLLSVFFQFVGRCACLLVLPVTIYLGVFAAHFMLSPNYSPHSRVQYALSPEFQKTLVGSDLNATWAPIAFGSIIRLRHEASGAGYLHSHPHTFPDGSKQQQVTVYPYPDDGNNFWRVLPHLSHNHKEQKIPYFEPVMNGAVIRLEHVKTGRRLHSHDIKAPVSDDKERHVEVSAYGDRTLSGDRNDHFKVEIINQGPNTPWNAIHSKVRLIHGPRSAPLFSHSKRLPKWGFHQQEVTCARGVKKDKTIWRVDYNIHKKMDKNATMAAYSRLGLFPRIAELHLYMWRYYQGLVGEQVVKSKSESPGTWVSFLDGVSYWTALNEHGKPANIPRHVYFMPNMMVWACVTLVALGFLSLLSFYGFASQRDFFEEVSWMRGGLIAASVAYAGFLLHFLPFMTVKNRDDLHIYLPAYYFGILLVGLVFDLLLRWTSFHTRVQCATVLVLGTLLVWYSYSSFYTGQEMTEALCEILRLSPSGHMDWPCGRPFKVEEAVFLPPVEPMAIHTGTPLKV